MTFRNFRRLPNGYSDLGPIQIPDRPVAFVLTDRADGTRYMLTFNTDSGEHLSITSPPIPSIVKLEGTQDYDADSAPVFDLPDGRWRLFVRGGRIGVEYLEFDPMITAVDQAPMYARQPRAQRLLLLKDTGSLSTVRLGYETNV